MKSMKLLSRLAAALGLATLLCGGLTPTLAQDQGGGAGGGGGAAGGGGGGRGPGGRGNFDPAQMQARMMERYRESLELQNDDEWKAIEPLITKVSEARRDASMGRGMFGRGPGGPGGNGPGGQGGNRRGPGGDASAESEALQKALESKAPAAEIKSALVKVREARKAKEAKLTAAQDELRKVLSVRQEAQAVLLGLLN